MRVGWKRLFRIDVEFVQWDLFEVLAQPGPQSPEELPVSRFWIARNFWPGRAPGRRRARLFRQDGHRVDRPTGPQYAAFKDALSAAFDEQGLRELVRFRLDEELATVAGGRNEDEIVYNLNRLVPCTGRVDDLLRAALAANPTSPDLQAFVRQLDG